MANVSFRFPGEAAYTYFEVTGTPEELTSMNYEMLAALYVNAQKGVLLGSIQAKQAIRDEKPQEPASEPEPEAPANPPKDDSEATKTLSEGLGGATEIDDVNAPPWDKPKGEAKPKPWESSKPKTEVSSDDFDF